tara:strand:- start:88 stop:396 length:309 start_codon:yes stop_codon:yes gene_type:complete
MSVDLKGQDNYPLIKNVTAVQTWLEIFLPSKASIITIGSEDKDLYVSFTGTDGGILAGIDKAFIKRNGYLSINRGRGTNQHNSIFVAVATGTTANVVVILEE